MQADPVLLEKMLEMTRGLPGQIAQELAELAAEHYAEQDIVAAAKEMEAESSGELLNMRAVDRAIWRLKRAVNDGLCTGRAIHYIGYSLMHYSQDLPQKPGSHFHCWHILPPEFREGGDPDETDCCVCNPTYNMHPGFVPRVVS